VRLFSISLRNLRIRVVATVMTMASIVVATALYAAILMMVEQTRLRYEGAYSASWAIIGPKDASQLEIVLNTVFNVGDAPALFPLKVAIDLRTAREFGHRGQIRYAIPQARGDSVSRYAFPVVATIDEFWTKFELHGTTLPFAEGQGFAFSWDELLQLADGMAANETATRAGEASPPPRPQLRPEWKKCVVGSRVARTLGLSLGDKITPVHGKPGEFGSHDHPEAACDIVGILAPTNSPIDSTIYLPLGVHLLIGGHEGGAFVVPLVPGKNPDDVKKMPVQGDMIGLTAIVLDPKDPVGDQILRNAFMRRPDGQVAKPREVVPKFLRQVGNAADALEVIAWLVLLVASVSITVAMYNTMNERRREIAIMRSLGARRHQILSIIVGEAAMLSTTGALLGVLLCHVCALLLRATVEDVTGVYLDWTAFAPRELYLVLAVGLLGAVAGLLPAIKGSCTQVADNLSQTY
jgi:putative ABC transport system permease protein